MYTKQLLIASALIATSVVQAAPVRVHLEILAVRGGPAQSEEFIDKRGFEFAPVTFIKGRVSAVKETLGNTSLGQYIQGTDGSAEKLVKAPGKPLELIDPELSPMRIEKDASPRKGDDATSRLDEMISSPRKSDEINSRLDEKIVHPHAAPLDAEKALVAAEKKEHVQFQEFKPALIHGKAPQTSYFIGADGKRVSYTVGGQLRSARDPSELGEFAAELKMDRNKPPIRKPVTLHGASPDHQIWRVKPTPVEEHVMGSSASSAIPQPFRTVGGAVAGAVTTVAGGIGGAVTHVAGNVAGGVGGAVKRVLGSGSTASYSRSTSAKIGLAHLAKLDKLKPQGNDAEAAESAWSLYKPYGSW